MIYEEITAGRLIARKIGRRTIVRRADALAWLRSLPRLSPGDDDKVKGSKDAGSTRTRRLDDHDAVTSAEDHIDERQAAKAR
jgi:hypothetical protein